MRQVSTLVALLVFSIVSQSQQRIIAQNVDPAPGAPRVSVVTCIVVKCPDGNEYFCPGSGPTLPDAEQDAINFCTANHCNGQPAMKINRPVPIDACDENGGEFLAMQHALALTQKPWRVEAILYYCDGTTLRGVFRRGNSCVEAKAKARKLILQLKDPCRRAVRICYVVHEAPCCPCPK